MIKNLLRACAATILNVVLLLNMALPFAFSADAEPGTTAPFSTSDAPKNNSEKQQGGPKIIASVPAKWAESYQKELEKTETYDAHEKKGEAYLQEGKHDLALIEFQTTLRLAGKYDMIGFMSAHENLVRVHEAAGNYKKALEHLAIVIRHWQSDFTRPKAERWKEALMAAAQNNFSEAARIYETLLAKAEDWERLQIQQRLDAMRARASAILPVQANKATADTSLITDFIVSEFKKETGIDLRNQEMALRRVHEAAQKTSGQLKTLEKTGVNLPFITADPSGPKHISMIITRKDLSKFASEKDRVI